MTREEAENLAKESKLVLEITEEYNSDVEAGKIAIQDPPYLEGYTVKENSTIKLVLSKGENIRKVPKVTGMTKDEAIQSIETEELKYEVIEEASSKVEAGYVIRQDPDADEELNAGETVKIYVSTGIKQITMEYVIGEKEENAKKTLTELGFEVKVVYEEDMSKDDGTVLKQSIDVGTTVEDGTEVILTVNKVAETKDVSVIINLLEITGGYTEPAEGEEQIGSSTVNITVNEETRTGISKNETKYSGITLSGKVGESLKVTLSIKDSATGTVIYSTSKTIKVGNENTVTFE